jgi:mRNA interferase YafQ
MLKRTFTKTFRKQLKLMGKRSLNLGKLREVMDMLINEQPLLPKHEDHPLHGNHRGKRECHIEGDWLLIYRIDKQTRKVIFHYTGSHSDLF